MGINGLLQQLKSISRPTHVSSYRGQKVAIDGYSWLHKGAYSCSRELCEGVWADGYIRYFVSRIEMLMGNGVIPVVVFDGCRLPMKADEEDSRRRGRWEALERARAHAESGNMAAANECYQRAVDIAPWMAKVVMEALRERDVMCLVAPYEADAQMSYLALRGDVYAVLTEDSDMLAYGCPRVLYKLDRSGSGEEVVLSDLPLVRELNMAGFDHDMLLQMCILAGCDFLPNMSGVGIKKAHAMIRKHRDFVKVVRFLRFNGTSPPPGYEVRFQRTIWLFRHQRVFCPTARALTHLRPLPAGGLGAADVLVLAALPPEGPEREVLPFLGPPMEADVAAGIAAGDVDPSTLQPFDLPAIYRGCNYPPRHLRPLLQPSPTHHATQGTQQQHGSQSQGGGGSQRRLSWGGAGPSQSQGSQHQHHHSQHRHHSHHHHGQHQQYMSQQSGGRYGHPAGKPPVAPKDRIDRYFFAPNPAASQPFRHHGLRSDGTGGQRAVPGHGSAADRQSGAHGSVPVVTLRGLPVEVVEAAAAGGGGGGGGGAPGAAVPDGLEEGGPGEPRAGLSGAEKGAEEDQDGDCVLHSAKRRRLADDAGRPAAEADGALRVTGPAYSGRSARLSSGTAAAVSINSGSLFARFRCDAAAGQQTRADGPPSYSQSQAPLGGDGGGEQHGGPGAGGWAEVVDGDADGLGYTAADGALGTRAAEAAPGAVDGGGGAAGVSGSAPDSQRAGGPFSQGFTRGWSSGADSECRRTESQPPGMASEYDSQYDSQLTSGCEGTGLPALHGAGGLVGGRSRAPARLAMEALFSEPSGCAAPVSEPAHPLCGVGSADGASAAYAGPAAGPGPGGISGVLGAGRQVRGALMAFQSLRQAGGPLVLGATAAATMTTDGSQPLCSVSMSLPSPTKESLAHSDPHRDPQLQPEARITSAPASLILGEQTEAFGFDHDPTQEQQQKQYDGAFPRRDPARPSGCAAGGGGVSLRFGKPQFSIYDLEDELHRDLDPDLFPDLLARPTRAVGDGVSPGLGHGAPASPVGMGGAGRRRLRGRALTAHPGSDDKEDDCGGEAEVTSPWKLPRNRSRSRSPSPQRAQLPGGAHVIRRGFLGTKARPMSSLLHPSAMRRLSAGQQQQLGTASQNEGPAGPEAEPGPAGASGPRSGPGLTPCGGFGRHTLLDDGLGAANGSGDDGDAANTEAHNSGGSGGGEEPDCSGSDEDPDVREFKRAVARSKARRRQWRQCSALRERAGTPLALAGGDATGGEQEGVVDAEEAQDGGFGADGKVDNVSDSGMGRTSGLGDGGASALEAMMEDSDVAAQGRGEEPTGAAGLGHQHRQDQAGAREADSAAFGAHEAAPAQGEQRLHTRGGVGASGQAPTAEDDDGDGNDEVFITAEISVGGGDGCAATAMDGTAGAATGSSVGFHSVEHMARFALVAKRTLDKLERSLPPPPPVAGMAPAAAGRPDPRQRTQPKAHHRRASFDGAGGGGGRLPAAAAAAAKPLTDFAFVRSAPKRRSTPTTRAGALDGTPLPGPRVGICRPSVFVLPADADADADAPAAEVTPGGSVVSLRGSFGEVGAAYESDGTARAADAGDAQAFTRHIEGGDGGDDSGRDAQEHEDSDGSEDVVIVRESAGPASGGGDGLGPRGGLLQRSGGAGSDRRVLAEMVLRRPFQAPRSNAGGTIGGAATAGGARAMGGGGKGKGVGMRGAGKESQQQPQQQRITAFQAFAFTNNK